MNTRPNQFPRIVLALQALAEKSSGPYSVKDLAAQTGLTESNLQHCLAQACERGQLLRTEQRGGRTRIRYLYALPPA